jgi:glycosyltransferase involved in cell wall biosynthesis
MNYMDKPIRVLMVTSEWVLPGEPYKHSFLGRQYNFLKREGIEIEIFFFKAHKKLFFYLLIWIRLHLKLLFSTNKYDLIHAQFGQSGVVAMPTKLPLIVTLRGCDILGERNKDGYIILKGHILQRLIQWMTIRAEAVIIVSAHMQKYLPSSVIPHIIPSGLDFDSLPIIAQVDARKQLGLSIDEKLVLFAANPDEHRKRYNLAKQAVELLNERIPAKLIVCWREPYEKIPIYMNACDVYIMTSRQEGSPNVVKEALACNLPVVSVPVGDVHERLDGVEGCEVCPDDDPVHLADALERVLRRGERIKGREAVANLDENILVQKVIAIYKDAIANHRR